MKRKLFFVGLSLLVFFLIFRIFFFFKCKGSISVPHKRQVRYELMTFTPREPDATFLSRYTAPDKLLGIGLEIESSEDVELSRMADEIYKLKIHFKMTTHNNVVYDAPVALVDLSHGTRMYGNNSYLYYYNLPELTISARVFKEKQIADIKVSVDGEINREMKITLYFTALESQRILFF